MELPDLVKACDLFVYLNLQFRSFQFEEEQEQEVPSTFVANIHQMMHRIIIYPGHLIRCCVAIYRNWCRDWRSTDYHGGISIGRSTTYPHVTSEEIINQDRLKYSVQVYKKHQRLWGRPVGPQVHDGGDHEKVICIILINFCRQL